MDKNAAEERPEGLYGNVFASAPPSAITKAVSLLPKTTMSNFIAMVAPKFGRGGYTSGPLRLLSLTIMPFSEA